jgi:hypothetical protein
MRGTTLAPRGSPREADESRRDEREQHEHQRADPDHDAAARRIDERRRRGHERGGDEEAREHVHDRHDDGGAGGDGDRHASPPRELRHGAQLPERAGQPPRQVRHEPHVGGAGAVEHGAERRQNAAPALDEQRVGEQHDGGGERDKLPPGMHARGDIAYGGQLAAQRPQRRHDERGDEDPTQDPQEGARNRRRP